MKYQHNFNRSENILILPNNTLRVPDAIMRLELLKANNIELPDFEVNLYLTINRKNKDFTIGLEVPSWLKNKFNNEWSYYWDIAPRTKMYEYINILSKQKFITNTTVLFSDKNAKDDVFNYDYYDGSIDSLEKYIIDKEITAVVMDDIDLLCTISDRKKIDINNLSFIISKIGYNYEFDKELGSVMVKKDLYEAQKNSFIEVAMLSLYNFDKDISDRAERLVNGGKDNG